MSFKFTKSNLNLDVYTVASKPTAPGANNDIAIITSVPMPNWIMSPDKPSGTPRSNGDVWIQYSVSGNTFNALKNNSMMIATISAWQYMDGAWVKVEAVSCQNGEWVNLITWIIEDGQTRISVDGVLRTADVLNVTYGTDYVDIYVTGTTTTGIATSQPLDVTSCKKLVAELEVVKLSEYICIGLSKALNAGSESVAVSNLVKTAQTTAKGRQTITLDISSVSGKYYPGILLKGGSSATDMQVRVYDFYLQ